MRLWPPLADRGYATQVRAAWWTLRDATERRRFLHDLTGYFGASPLLTPENFPPNYTIPAMAAGMADGHAAYGVPSCVDVAIAGADGV